MAGAPAWAVAMQNAITTNMNTRIANVNTRIDDVNTQIGNLQREVAKALSVERMMNATSNSVHFYEGAPHGEGLEGLVYPIPSEVFFTLQNHQLNRLLVHCGLDVPQER